MNTSAFALRASYVLRLLPSAAESVDHALKATGVVANASATLPQQPALTSNGGNSRHFSIRSSGLDLQPSQRTQLLEAQWTRRFLPNRARLCLHFTAHSIMLLPEPQQQQHLADPQQQVQSLLNFAPHSVRLVPTPTGKLPVPPGDMPYPPVPLLADSVKRKRKLKMKKHKHRKRLKKVRHQNK
jgi:hypothetical protein